MRLDQIAICAQTEAQAEAIKKHYGILNSNWVEDNVSGMASLYTGAPGEAPDTLRVNAYLQFNYDLGIELEIIRFLDATWHEGPLMAPFVSHFGFHLDNNEHFPNWNNCIMELVTDSHSNPNLQSLNKTYHYRIYDTRSLIGAYTKVIKRIQQ